METKIEDVPDDSESRDQIRINLVIKSEQITEVIFWKFLFCVRFWIFNLGLFVPETNWTLVEYGKSCPVVHMDLFLGHILLLHWHDLCDRLADNSSGFGSTKFNLSDHHGIDLFFGNFTKKKKYLDPKKMSKYLKNKKNRQNEEKQKHSSKNINKVSRIFHPIIQLKGET